MTLREARVDLAAIASNVAILRAVAGDVLAMVVVKADGYGHGAIPSARAALEGGADWLGVADIDEARALRDAGIDAPVLAWLHDPLADFSSAIANRIDIGVSYLDQLDAVAHADGRGSVHLKVDTGLGRNGAVESEWAGLFAAAAAHERAGRLVVTGLWSHLAGADDQRQVARFSEALVAAASAGLEPEIAHIAATGAGLAMPGAHFSLVRWGLGAYGLSPSTALDAASIGLIAAMQLSGAVVSVKRVPAGTGVSYGHRYVTERNTTLALVPLGYADGLPRQASGNGPVRIRDATYRVAGIIAMDQVVIDVGDAQVAVGDRAVFFGDRGTGAPSADDWAAAAGTINYEIVTRIGGRVSRVYSR